jgi:hypothetical protein
MAKKSFPVFEGEPLPKKTGEEESTAMVLRSPPESTPKGEEKPQKKRSDGLRVKMSEMASDLTEMATGVAQAVKGQRKGKNTKAKENKMENKMENENIDLQDLLNLHYKILEAGQRREDLDAQFIAKIPDSIEVIKGQTLIAKSVQVLHEQVHQDLAVLLEEMRPTIFDLVARGAVILTAATTLATFWELRKANRMVIGAAEFRDMIRGESTATVH